MKRKHTLSPEQYSIIAVHTRFGIKRVLLFSQEIIRAEWRADTVRIAVFEKQVALVAAQDRTICSRQPKSSKISEVIW